jgi:electron transfer flavoprotein alpha subunit
MAGLLFADHNNRTLNPATAKALTAALAMTPEVDVLVAGHGCRAVAEAAAGLTGVRRVLLADAPQLDRGLAEELAALVTPLMADYDSLIAPSTTLTRNFTPRVAALLDTAQVSDISAVKSPTVFERPIYAGNAIQTVEALGAKKVVTVRATSFAAAPEGGAAPINLVAAPAPIGLSAFIGEELSQSDRPELTAARVVVSGGRGMQSADNFKILDRLAGKLNAAVGASRAAVDAGFAPNDYQVGQTGKVVAPELYIAVGISGAIQHLAGMKDSRVIVAINKDADAPIFEVADYGIVGDLFEVVPAIVEALNG